VGFIHVERVTLLAVHYYLFRQEFLQYKSCIKMPAVFICSPNLLFSYVFGHDRLTQHDAQYANVQVELNNSDL